MSICVKRSVAPIAYTIDWGRGWLGTAGIVASDWTVDGVAGGLAASGNQVTDGVTRTTITGGVPGANYAVRGHVRLSDGRTASRTLAVQVGVGR
jgi:hypothetical protein